MKECVPSDRARCWKEPRPRPHYISMDKEPCPFHDNPASKPINIEKDGIILQNPVISNWGKWQDWIYCPKGMYATGINVFSVTIGSIDQVGKMAISFKCQTPGGNETGVIIESSDPNFRKYPWNTHHMCSGAVVGIRVNSVAKNGKDEIGIDNVQAMCSCSEPAFKTNYPEGDRGEWTTPQFCKKRQAVCGMQTQMQELVEDHMYIKTDHYGMTNLKVKCCDVTNPLDTCVPTEDRLHILDCDNTNGDESLICELQAMIGLSYDYKTEFGKSSFYSSIGYSFDDVKEKMSKKIVAKLDGDIKKWGSQRYEYTWDDIDEPAVLEDVTVSKKNIVVKKGDKVELYQYIGRCGHFIIRTNKYLRHIKRGKSNIFEYFEI